MPCWSQVGQSLYSVSKHLALYLNMHTNRASPTQPLSIKCSYRNLSFGKGRPVTGMGFSFCSIQDFLRGLCSPRAVTHRQHSGRSTLNSREVYIKTKGVTDMIPYAKMSKRQKKEHDRKNRTTWQFSPVSRVVQSKKTYNRKRLDPVY